MNSDIQPSRTILSQVSADYLRTFARLLDPSLPTSTDETGPMSSSWPAGQKLAFGTVCSVAIACFVVALFSAIA